MRRHLRQGALGLVALWVYVLALLGANIFGISLGLGGRTFAQPGAGVPASYLADATMPSLRRLDPSIATDAARDSGASIDTGPVASQTPVTNPAPYSAPSSKPVTASTPPPQRVPQSTPAPAPPPTPAPTQRPAFKVTVPGVPTNVIAVHAKSTRYVSWQAPTSNGGSPILYYVIRGSYGFSATAPAGSTSLTLVNLTNGSYTFTVTAVNVVGAGRPSAPSNPLTG